MSKQRRSRNISSKKSRGLDIIEQRLGRQERKRHRYIASPPDEDAPRENERADVDAPTSRFGRAVRRLGDAVVDVVVEGADSWARRRH